MLPFTCAGLDQYDLKRISLVDQTVFDVDPSKNVAYSAKFLRNLYSANGRDWKRAARKYHSSNPTQGELYTQRLEDRFQTYQLAGLTRGRDLF